MTFDSEVEKLGMEFATDAVNQFVEHAEMCCDWERRRIELTNEAPIKALEIELAIRAESVNEIERRRRAAERPGDRRSRRRMARYYWSIAFGLTVASFFFLLIAFEPFRLGWKAILYCLGVAVVSPFCLDQFLESCESKRIFKGIATLAAVGAISSLIILAVVRGNLLAQQIQTVTPAVELDSGEPAPAQPQNTFYQDTLGPLRLAMALLALAIELAVGLAVHRARTFGPGSGEDYNELTSELRREKQVMAALFHERTALSNEASAFAARFRVNFHRAILTRALQRGVTTLLLLFLIGATVCRGQTPPNQRLDVVIALDLSASVAVEGSDSKSEFDKNVAGVGQLLGTVPQGSRVTVLGITGDSFSQPYILLSGKVAEDPGYFSERVASARQQLVRAWSEKSAHLSAQTRNTDILGALVVAGQLFSQSPDPRRKILVLYSDMRQSTRHLNLETNPSVAVAAALARTSEDQALTSLKGVEVYALGVDAAKRDMRQWIQLRQFWVAYFAAVGATLKTYSILREPLNFTLRP
jgi:hypothetical protein